MFRTIIRRLRSTQPLNHLATTAIKKSFSPWGYPPQRLTKHLPRIGLVEARLPNGRVLRLWSQGDDGIASQVFWEGWNGYERETSSVFFEIAQRSDVVVDVGAHVGYYSLLAALANPNSKVLAFEPLPQAIRRFKRNLKENGVSNVEVFECAAGDFIGSATLFHKPVSSKGIPSSSGLSKRFFSLPYFVASGVSECTTVEVTTLDEVVLSRNINRVDLVKIDTETTEPSVLSGMTQILERDRPDIIFEMLPEQGTGPVISEQLVPLGYQFYLLRETGAERQCNIVDHATCWNYLARSTDDRFSEPLNRARRQRAN